MVILGIDPGIAIVGYGIVKYEGNKFSVIHYGSILTESKKPLSERLKEIYDAITDMIQIYKPDVMAIEELFFNNNAKTALTVGHGRGVAILAAANANMSVSEYTPLQIKQAVVGYGRADKKQVQQMVKILLALKEIPKPDDTADALAVSICHAHSEKINKIIG